MKQHSERDPDIEQLKKFIKYGSPQRIDNPILSKMKSNIPFMTILKGCVMFKDRVFIPATLRQDVLSKFHENHPGIVAMKSIARELIWYPGLDKDIEQLVQSCVICQSVRSKPPQDTYITWPTPSRPWSRIHIDHFFYDNHICPIIVDSLSK